MTWVIVGAVVAAVLALLCWLGRERPADADVAKAPAEGSAGPLRVMRMRTTGFLRIDDPHGDRTEEQLPASPYGHGEFPQGVWAAADSTVFVVGKVYTGRPGPDHGVLYRRSPDGAWAIAGVIEGHSFHSICGTAADDVYAGALDGVAWFDGATLTFTPLVEGMTHDVWVQDGRAYARSFDGRASFALHGAEARPADPRPLPERDNYRFRAGDLDYTVFDRSVELGEETLSVAEEAELRADLAQLDAALKDGSARVRRL